MSTMLNVPEADPKFNRDERANINVLQRRLAHLKVQLENNDRTDLSYVAAEVQALTWVLETVEGTAEPLEIRMYRFEQNLRLYGTRLGRVEKSLAELVDEEE